MVGERRWARGLRSDDVPANAGATNGNGDLALLEASAGLDALGAGTRLGQPELVLGVGVDANVGLEAGGAIRRGTHFVAGRVIVGRGVLV